MPKGKEKKGKFFAAGNSYLRGDEVQVGCSQWNRRIFVIGEKIDAIAQRPDGHLGTELTLALTVGMKYKEDECVVYLGCARKYQRPGGL